MSQITPQSEIEDLREFTVGPIPAASPRIAALFQLRDGVISDRVSFLFCQTLFQAASASARCCARTVGDVRTYLTVGAE